MKKIKIALLIGLMSLAAVISGCQNPDSVADISLRKQEIYHQRGDGLRIPTYAYIRQ